MRTILTPIFSRHRVSLTACAVILLASTPTESRATDARNLDQPVQVQPSGSWLRDQVIRPVAPFELVPGKNANDWTFMIEPSGWSPGLYGNIGIKNLPVAEVNQSPIDILKKLDWGFFARGEVRKGRWGVLGDGFFAQFSMDSNPQDAIYKDISVKSQQSMVTVALAYRVIDDKRYFVDLYAGGRYSYLGASASATINRAGVEALSQRIIDRAIAKFGPGLLAKYPGLKNVPASVLQQAKQLGIKKLSDRIEKELPKSVEQSRWWIDPIVGLRGQVNFSRWFFAAAQADAGGFGAGSQITWNTQATLGVNFSRNIALEAGYRYMYIDYDKDNFLYNVNMPGVFAGLIFKF
ncbi:MAG: hypothetical protein ACKOEG_03395 [Chthoniobacterales bacterium]